MIVNLHFWWTDIYVTVIWFSLSLSDILWSMNPLQLFFEQLNHMIDKSAIQIWIVEFNMKIENSVTRLSFNYILP